MKHPQRFLNKKEIVKLFLLCFWIGGVATLATIMNSIAGKNDFRVMAGHWYSVSSSVTRYYGSGACSGSCYKMTGSSSYYSSNGASCNASCGTTSAYSGYTSCSWISQKYYYPATGSGTAYGLTGADSCVSGSGSCYKIGATSTGYTDSACGGSTCGTNTTITGATSCSWISTKYSYSVSGSSSTGYDFSGATACSASGTGNCYAAGSSLSGNYCSSGGGCDSGYCGGCSASYYTASTCTANGGSDQDTVTLTKAATNLSKTKSITFLVYSPNRTGSFLQFQMGETAASEQTFNFSINALNTWELKTWDITGIAATSRDAITKLAFKNSEASSGFTFYFDNIQALADVPNSPTTCVIKENPNDNSLTPTWADNSNNEDGFQLEKNTNSAGFTFLTNLSPNIINYLDNSVASGNTYTYRIRSYKAGIGITEFSDYCNFPALDLHKGNLRENGVQENGVRIN